MIPKFRIPLMILAASVALSSLTGCGDSDDNDTISSRVIDLELDKSVLSVGEGTVLQVDISYDAGDVFGDDDDFSVVIKLPEGIGFREGTSEIDDVVGDNGIGAVITPCPATGETILIFNLDSNDLDDAKNPDGDADARLKLTVDGLKSTSAGVIEAFAQQNPLVQCGTIFLGEARIGISVR